MAAEFKLMKEFMIEITLPEVISPDFILKIPPHRERINELIQIGIVRSYTLSEDRSKLWILALGNSKEEIIVLLEGLPLYEYMNFKIHNLAFHLYTKQNLPEISLN